MASTLDTVGVEFERGDWRAAGLRFFSHGYFLRSRYGRRVRKVSIDAGFTCPNVDGTVTVGGCSFCDNRSFSPSRRVPRRGILQQIDEGIARMRHRYDCEHFIAYFQPATNTYAPVDRLRAVYEEALAHPHVVGLAIGTRADCVPDDVLDLLEQMAQHTYVSVEYGMQTIHNRSVDWMNRGHDHGAFLDAVARSRNRGFEIGTHVILGLPGESRDDMLATAYELARLHLDSLKIHNLYAVKNTRLAEQVARGEVALLDRESYVHILIDFLERLPPTMVVERLMGDAPPEFLVAPNWCLDKPAFYQALTDELTRRDTWQGRARSW
ncbi:MAG: TIGR01212 family radical SAM protein [Pirellulaceae bacterium]